MNIQRVKELTESLQSIESAKFSHPNWAFIGFDTTFKSVMRQSVIRTSPLNEHHCQMREDLQAAIQPVLDKYANIFKEAIKKEASQ